MIGISKMNSVAISNIGPFPFSPHHNSAGDLCKYLQYPAPVLAQVTNSLVCDNVSRLLKYRAGVMVGVIGIKTLEVDIIDVDRGRYDL